MMVEQDEAGRLTPGDPQGPTNEAFRVVGLPGGRLGEAAGMLARCFHANPNFVDLFPDEEASSCALPCTFAAGLRDAKGTARAERGQQ
jgi:hypothetical protein